MIENLPLMNIDTLEQLTQQWRQNLDAQSVLFRRDAIRNLTLYLMNGASGNGNKIEVEWAEEAQRRQAVLELRWRGQSKEYLEAHAFECLLEDYGVEVAHAMSWVVGKVYGKIFGVDIGWNANSGSLFEMLVREEVKLRQTFSIGYLYSELCRLGHREQAVMHLVAWVRNGIKLRPGTDLFRALQSAGHINPRTGLWVELQAEVPLLVDDLSPRGLKMLPGRAAYRIRKRLLPPVQEARTDNLEGFCAAQGAPISYNNVESFQETEYLREMFDGMAQEAGLTKNEAHVCYSKLVLKMTETEIASEMSRAVGTIRSWHHRAKTKIKHSA